jgi:uncharacterized protein (TIGR02646 family)
LAATATTYLSNKTKQIIAAADPKTEADNVYAASRKTKTFTNSVVSTLSKLAGRGERCMFCGSSEASQVEHFWPKSTYPEKAMTWDNFVWICGVCNQAKGNRFPIFNGAPEAINPMDDDVWKFFSIDEFGFMAPIWDVAADDFDRRGKITEELIGLNRQAVQEARQLRYLQLRGLAEDSIALHEKKKLTKQQVGKRIADWIEFPLHPEVAQYFLKGRGQVVEPFATLLKI